MDSKALKWALGIMSAVLLLFLVLLARHYFSAEERAYRDGYVYHDGQYVKMQRVRPHRRGDRDDDDRDDDDRRRRASGQSSYFDRFFRSFRKGDDD